MAPWYVGHAGEFGGLATFVAPHGTPSRGNGHGSGDTAVSNICCAGLELLRLSPCVPVCLHVPGNVPLIKLTSSPCRIWGGRAATPARPVSGQRKVSCAAGWDRPCVPISWTRGSFSAPLPGRLSLDSQDGDSGLESGPERFPSVSEVRAGSPQLLLCLGMGRKARMDESAHPWGVKDLIRLPSERAEFLVMSSQL